MNVFLVTALVLPTLASAIPIAPATEDPRDHLPNEPLPTGEAQSRGRREKRQNPFDPNFFEDLFSRIPNPYAPNFPFQHFPPNFPFGSSGPAPFPLQPNGFQGNGFQNFINVRNLPPNYENSTTREEVIDGRKHQITEHVKKVSSPDGESFGYSATFNIRPQGENPTPVGPGQPPFQEPIRIQRQPLLQDQRLGSGPQAPLQENIGLQRQPLLQDQRLGSGPQVPLQEHIGLQRQPLLQDQRLGSVPQAPFQDQRLGSVPQAPLQEHIGLQRQPLLPDQRPFDLQMQPLPFSGAAPFPIPSSAFQNFIDTKDLPPNYENSTTREEVIDGRLHQITEQIKKVSSPEGQTFGYSATFNVLPQGENPTRVGPGQPAFPEPSRIQQQPLGQDESLDLRVQPAKSQKPLPATELIAPVPQQRQAAPVPQQRRAVAADV